jgi:hypothetical protein
LNPAPSVLEWLVIVVVGFRIVQRDFALRRKDCHRIVHVVCESFGESQPEIHLQLPSQRSDAHQRRAVDILADGKVFLPRQARIRLRIPHVAFEKSLGRDGELLTLRSGGARETLELREIRLFVPPLRHDSQASHCEGDVVGEGSAGKRKSDSQPHAIGVHHDAPYSTG